MTGEQMPDTERYWCILRTRAANTLSLVDTLTRDGFTAWTPVETISRQIPRKKVRVERRVPFVPTYVFADARQLSDLRLLAALPVKDHVDFVVYRYTGKFVFIADRQLDALRAVEDRATRRAMVHRKAAPIPAGAMVRATSGIMTGLPGVVESSGEKITIVCFLGSNLSWEVTTSTLKIIDVKLGEAREGAAA